MDIRKQNIIKISEELLSELEKFKENNPEFTFPLRERDSTRSKEVRLDEGCWFLGSDYIQIGLFNKRDSARACYTIGFVIHFKKDGSIKDNCLNISFKSGSMNQDEINFHVEIARKLGISIDSNNVGENPYPDIDYIKNLNDFLTRVRNICLLELKNKNLENGYIVSINDFNKQLEITNNIRKNLKKDDDENIDTNQLTNDEFVELVSYIGKNKVIEFYDLIDRIVKDLALNADDPRLSFTTARGNKLTLNIGQRKCIAIRPSKKKEPYFFISDNNSPESQGCVVKAFDGPVMAYECTSTDIVNFRKYLPNIIEASKKELERSSKSGYKKYNQALFEKTVFDKDYRKEIFELAFKPINYWAINCNLEKWKGDLEIEQYNSGTWKVAKQHEKIIKRGDQFLIRFSGNRAGIYCFGTITGDPQIMEDDKDRVEKFAKDPSEFTGNSTRIPIDYEIKLLSNPILKVKILSSGIFEFGTKQYNFFDNPQGVTTSELTEEQFLKLKSMSSEFNQDNVIENFKNYLDKIFKGANTTRNYINYMPKIQDWLIKNGICPEGFNIWRDTQKISDIENTLSNEKKGEWKDLNSRDNENGFYNAPWRKWVEFNNQNNSTIIIGGVNSSSQVKEPKNIILYGPPGTGKTYNSIDKAVEIADIKSYIEDDHKSNKKRFDELKKEGQIEFVTFHQNYSYEDFMIGIRPDLSGNLSGLSFKPHYGIFYNLVKRALLNYKSSKLSQGKLIDPKDLLNKFLEQLQNGKVDLKTATGVPFSVEYLSEETIQLVYQNDSRKNTLSVQTLLDICEEKRVYTSSLKTYFYPLKDYILKDRILLDVKKEELKKFVIVIDEINRANISKVFGELITLLEDDKRIGEDEELNVTLPNGEEFSVPPNLYVIGTMNTADKSIALIDIALRRRFEFIGYYPNYKEDKAKGYNSYEVALLKDINTQIFKKKNSSDYLIGQAYFMKNLPIRDVIKNKVIPLLMEYFSNKTDIVSKILNDTNQLDVVYDESDFTWKIDIK